MSNTYKVIIAVIAIVVLGATSIFLIGQNRLDNKVVTTQSSSTVSSVKSQMVSSSSSIQMVSTSSSVSSNVNSQTPQTSSSVKVDNKVEVSTPNIEFLDSNNPPQYIKDYLACTNKDIKNSENKTNHFGVFLENSSGMIEYKCPPKMESLECKKNIVFVYDSKTLTPSPKSNDGFIQRPYQLGWNCDQFYASQIAYPFMVDVCSAFGADLLPYINENDTQKGGCISLKNINIPNPFVNPQYFHFTKILILK